MMNYDRSIDLVVLIIMKKPTQLKRIMRGYFYRIQDMIVAKQTYRIGVGAIGEKTSNEYNYHGESFFFVCQSIKQDEKCIDTNYISDAHVGDLIVD